jgi:hypothetical protein
MSTGVPLTDAEIRCLQKVAAGAFRNLVSPPDAVEAMILRGLVSASLIMAVPFTPSRYDYQLTLYGIKVLEKYRDH